MALQLAYTSPLTGASFGSAYHRINGFTVDTLNKLGRVEVSIYVDDATRLSGKDAVADISVPFGPAVFDQLDAASGATTRARAYAYLKSLIQYAGATDV
jgi:hypothetical protein